MNYEYTLRLDEPVESGVKRIASGKVETAISHIDDDGMNTHETVHEVRKRCKEVRAVLRLVRGPVGDAYSEENVWYRDIGRELSEVRDAGALLETFDDLLVPAVDDEIDDTRLTEARERLIDRRDQIAETIGVDERLAQAREDLETGLGRIDAWSVDATGFDGVSHGVAKSYRRGRKRLAEAHEDPSTEVFHEWRKRVKYHRYHARLLRANWVGPLKARRAEVKTLSDVLGDEHDLAVFGEVLDDEPDLFDADVTEVFEAAIEERRDALQNEARPLGRKIFAEDPDRLTDRLGAYWDAAHA